jgi:hypothetical protein
MTFRKILQEIQVVNFKDERGILDVAEFQSIVNFETQRIYYISNVPESSERGSHAHKELKQVFFALVGNFKLTVTDGLVTETVDLVAHGSGYFLPAGYWRDLTDFSNDAVCLVLASNYYDEKDYISSFAEYLEWKQSA